MWDKVLKTSRNQYKRRRSALGAAMVEHLVLLAAILFLGLGALPPFYHAVESKFTRAANDLKLAGYSGSSAFGGGTTGTNGDGNGDE